MTKNDLLIGVVGPCASGKSTLVSALKTLDFRVKHIAQEHSYVKDMWRKISNPDLLIYLDVSFIISTSRTGTNWTKEIFNKQVERLSHAREHADIYIDTNDLTPQQVLEKILENVKIKESMRFSSMNKSEILNVADQFNGDFDQAIQRRELDELKNTFVALVSHELRTPLNLMAGYLDLSIDEIENDPLQAKEYLGIVERNTNNIIRIVQELTDFSRLQLGKEITYFDPISIEDAFKQTYELFKSNLQKKNVSLIVDLPDDVRALKFDGESLIILFRNLVSNAVKFSADGGKVLITGKINKSLLSITIQDWASPIPVSKAETIFEDFRQLENHMTRRYEGMGLGLAVARRTARFLGGNIQLLVREDGNTFEILLPVKDEESPDNKKLP